MIRHIVLLSFNAHTSEISRLAMADSLALLPKRIPLIRNWTQGFNVGHGERNADFALVCEFETVEDLQAYQIHPEHQAVLKNLIRPIVREVSIVDFEL